MKKILIISYMFAPRAEIGAIRWTKIAKYMQRNENIISDVLTLEVTNDQDALLARDLEELSGKVFRIPHSSDGFKTKASARPPYQGEITPGFANLAEKIKRSRFVSTIRGRFERKAASEGMWKAYRQGEDFCEQAVKYLRENNIRPDEYDDVVVSFGPVGCALLALRIKELYPSTRLVMDFRDSMDNFMQSAEMNRKYKEIQDRLCQLADVVIAVGHEGYADKIYSGDDKSKLHVITNGYDPEDMEEVNCAKDGKFSFTFTGSLYDGVRDMSMLFKILSDLVKDGVIDRKDIIVKHAGRDFLKLMVQAQRHGMGDVLRDYGLITRKECLELQKSSRMLAFTSWNFKDNECNLNAKLFEYMLMKCPIIGIATGSKANSEARRIVEACNVGVVYENGDKKVGYAALYDFLKADYERFKQGLDSIYDPVNSELEKYDYRNIASRIAELL